MEPWRMFASLCLSPKGDSTATATTTTITTNTNTTTYPTTNHDRPGGCFKSGSIIPTTAIAACGNGMRIGSRDHLLSEEHSE